MSKRLFILLIPAAAASAWGAHAAQTANTEAPPGGGTPAALAADDHVEIRNLAGRYSHALDLGEPAAWAEVFTEDGVMDMVAQGYEIEGDALRSLPRDGERAMRTERKEQRIDNIEHRVDRIEQILPALATRDHVSDAITASEGRMRTHVSDAITASEGRMRTHVSDAITASEERMRTHVSDAITASEERMRTHVSDEITASEQRTRTYFDVIAESLRHDVRLVAEAVAALSERVR